MPPGTTSTLLQYTTNSQPPQDGMAQQIIVPSKFSSFQRRHCFVLRGRSPYSSCERRTMTQKSSFFSSIII